MSLLQELFEGYVVEDKSIIDDAKVQSFSFNTKAKGTEVTFKKLFDWNVKLRVLPKGEVLFLKKNDVEKVLNIFNTNDKQSEKMSSIGVYAKFDPKKGRNVHIDAIRAHFYLTKGEVQKILATLEELEKMESVSESFDDLDMEISSILEEAETLMDIEANIKGYDVDSIIDALNQVKERMRKYEDLQTRVTKYLKPREKSDVTVQGDDKKVDVGSYADKSKSIKKIDIKNTEEFKQKQKKYKEYRTALLTYKNTISGLLVRINKRLETVIERFFKTIPKSDN